MAAQTKSSGKAPGITRRSLGSPGESSRSAHRVMVARRGRTHNLPGATDPWAEVVAGCARGGLGPDKGQRIRRRDTGDEGHAKPRRSGVRGLGA